MSNTSRASGRNKHLCKSPSAAWKGVPECKNREAHPSLALIDSTAAKALADLPSGKFDATIGWPCGCFTLAGLIS